MSPSHCPRTLPSRIHLSCAPLPSCKPLLLFELDAHVDCTVPIENIKELRVGVDARYYREQFQLSHDYEDKWLTVIYVLDGGYKTLHLIAATRDIFQMWDVTLRRLHAIRQQLMSGLGSADMRQAIWEKQFWKGADDEQDQRIDFDDVERLCRRLNINPSRDDLLRRFQVRGGRALTTCTVLIPAYSKRTARIGATSTSLTSSAS